MTGFAAINLALIDPPQWGWSAGGTVVNLATPQEVGWSFCTYGCCSLHAASLSGLPVVSILETEAIGSQK
jgi:hypothetical protein